MVFTSFRAGTAACFFTAFGFCIAGFGYSATGFGRAGSAFGWMGGGVYRVLLLYSGKHAGVKRFGNRLVLHNCLVCGDCVMNWKPFSWVHNGFRKLPMDR